MHVRLTLVPTTVAAELTLEIEDQFGPIAIDPQVKIVPESRATVVRCLYARATKNIGMTEMTNTIGSW